ncbi:hypothetical protein CDEN61S_02582 [Castellaniella denitrificans]
MPNTPPPLELSTTLSLRSGDQSWGTERRMALLAAIGTEGSISAAARKVGLSYKAAWDAVDMMNSLAGGLLVERVTGGKRGGGAHLRTDRDARTRRRPPPAAAGEDQLDPVRLQRIPPASRAGHEQHQQVIAGHRGRQHHGQGQERIDHVAPARRPARQSPGHGDPADRRQHGRPAGDLQRQQQRDPDAAHRIRAWRTRSGTARPDRRPTARTSGSRRLPARGRHAAPGRSDRPPAWGFRPPGRP